MDLTALSEKARRRARQFLEQGSAPVEPRDSAAVVLLRDTPTGPQCCLLLRRHAMATSGGVPVFPGGMIDPQDLQTPCTGDGPAPDRVVAGAVRELFEEAGVLLAGPDGDDLPVDDKDWSAVRVELEAHRLTFAAFLNTQGWTVRADLLRLWSTWVTPDFEPRRYRNAFFVAALPAGQQPRDGSTESAGIRWYGCDDLLRGASDGSLEVLPPQLALALELREYRSVAEILAAATGLPREVVSPGVDTTGAEPVLTLPEHLVHRAASWAG